MNSIFIEESLSRIFNPKILSFEEYIKNVPLIFIFTIVVLILLALLFIGIILPFGLFDNKKDLIKEKLREKFKEMYIEKEKSSKNGCVSNSSIIEEIDKLYEEDLKKIKFIFFAKLFIGLLIYIPLIITSWILIVSLLPAILAKCIKIAFWIIFGIGILVFFTE